MKNKLFIIAFIGLACLSSCKKSCYVCTQYCAYCVSASDSSFLLEACALTTNEKINVTNHLRVWQDSGYRCNQLNTQTTVCDDKGHISSAVNYYQKENYFCDPQ